METENIEQKIWDSIYPKIDKSKIKGKIIMTSISCIDNYNCQFKKLFFNPSINGFKTFKFNNE